MSNVIPLAKAHVPALLAGPLAKRPSGKFSSQRMGRYPSGQRGQTVNLLAYAYAGSNPALPTTFNDRESADGG